MSNLDNAFNIDSKREEGVGYRKPAHNAVLLSAGVVKHYTRTIKAKYYCIKAKKHNHMTIKVKNNDQLMLGNVKCCVAC